MNGAPVGDAQWQGKDPSSSYDFVGRIGAEWGTRAIGAPVRQAGVSALSGHDLHPGTPPTKDHLSWSDDNHDGMVEQNELTGDPRRRRASPRRVSITRRSASTRRFAWCLQWAGAGKAFAEGIIATNLDRGLYYADPIATNRPLRELGFQIGAVQQLRIARSRASGTTATTPIATPHSSQA